MSPTKMLQSCGNSSKLLMRKKEPIGVKCELASAIKWVATAGVPNRILRNFGILKIVLFLPTRSDQYRTGPLDVKRTAIATSSTGTNKIRAARQPRKISKTLLIPLPPAHERKPAYTGTISCSTVARFEQGVGNNNKRWFMVVMQI